MNFKHEKIDYVAATLLECEKMHLTQNILHFRHDVLDTVNIFSFVLGVQYKSDYSKFKLISSCFAVCDSCTSVVVLFYSAKLPPSQHTPLLCWYVLVYLLCCIKRTYFAMLVCSPHQVL